MNILISEDNEYKFNHISKVIKTLIPEASITHAATRNRTLNILRDNTFSIHIQDMQMPIFEDDYEIMRNAGADILRRIRRKSEHKDMFSIVCSSDPEAELELDNLGVSAPFITFDGGKFDWQEELKTLILNHLKK